jgi:class 3 adenylate cyclase
MTVPVQFATTSDGVRIAYAAQGDGSPLVFLRAWITHLELMAEEPQFRRFFEALEQRFRVVRFDARGNGLSQRAVASPELDAFVLDTEAVVDACGLDEFVLWGSCFGGPVAIAYAARHPERVQRLILEGTFPTWTDLRTVAQQRAAGDLVRMMQSSPTMATTAASYLTDAEPVTRHETRVERVIASVDPDYLARLYVLAARMDVHAEVENLAVPTLVLHAHDSQVYPAEGARVLAAAIPGAQYVDLPGRHHNPWEGDAIRALAAMCDFCGVVPVAPAPNAIERVSIVMFTDIVGSTDIADRLGDETAAVLRRAQESIVADAARQHAGTVIKYTGDGALARFETASAALRAADAVHAAVIAFNEGEPPAPLEVRVGLNAGEPVEERGDIHGAAVNLAARVCAAAGPNEVFLTQAVRDLVTGKGFRFDDRGLHTLKGFADAVQLYALDAG